MSDLQLYNTLSRELESFKPITPGKAGVYSCGPTVYGFAHIGNLRSFLFADVLRRVLEVNGLDVKQIMNITDVGHLTDDADAGEDKMLVAMRREGRSAYEIAEFYTEQFFNDAAELNLKPAHEFPRATKHIDEQIKMIQDLEKNRYTYTTSDGVYFDTSKLESYGKLSGQSADEKQAGARVDMGEKRSATDFALWKFAPKGVNREMNWESPWGDGFPGWHIECSAMSVKYLDAPFDIHTGGADHIAVHHENELAQTEGALGKRQANIWMHGEFLMVDGGKMSKSLGNLYTLQEIKDKGLHPLSFRYLNLGSHYRSKLNFTWGSIEGAENALRKLWGIMRNWDKAGSEGVTKYEERMLGALNQDLNTAKALAELWKMVDDDSISTDKKAKTALWLDEVLGLSFNEYIATPLNIPSEVQDLLDKREEARANKDFEASDRIRDEISELGFVVEDTPKGQLLSEIPPYQEGKQGGQ